MKKVKRIISAENHLHISIPRIGEGIFLANDIAEILKLPYSTVRYWMNGFWYNYTFNNKKIKAVNFYTLIEFYIYFQLRSEKISPHKIKEFHKWLSKEFKTAYPFASIEIKTHEKQLWYYLGDTLLKGDIRKQPVLKPFIEPFLKKIEFGDNSLAKRYFPLGGNSKNIVVDPLHQLGQPTINGTNIQTKTIYNLFKAGETKDNICSLYDISNTQVSDAIIFHSKSA